MIVQGTLLERKLCTFPKQNLNIKECFHSTFPSSGAYNHLHGGGVLHSSHQSPLIHETEFAAATSTQPPPHLPSGDSGASVNSDYSSGGNSCSTAGGGDRSPPYLPRNSSNSVKRNDGRVSMMYTETD